MKNKPNSPLISVMRNHKGKSLTKWSNYLPHYERIFHPIRQEKLNVLEIGVQNGGSLEIWSKLFVNAKHIVGIDIDPKCEKLKFKDPRINVLIGDINESDTLKAAQKICPIFDIIIDDGCHTSSSIIKSFASLWPKLSAGGLYIVEDLHCSYFSTHEGGLYYPGSSMSFFKALSDCLNGPSWSKRGARTKYLQFFEKKYGVKFDEEATEQISSIEFVSSMCFIRKIKDERENICNQVFFGKDTLVLHEAKFDLEAMMMGQLKNSWNNNENTWNGDAYQLDLDLKELQCELDLKASKITGLQAQLEGEKLNNRVKDCQIQSISTHLDSMCSSYSWKLTAPFRKLNGFLKKREKLLKYIKTTFLLFSKTLRKPHSDIMTILEKLAEDPSYRDSIESAIGLSPKYLSFLAHVAYFYKKCFAPIVFGYRVIIKKIFKNTFSTKVRTILKHWIRPEIHNKSTLSSKGLLFQVDSPTNFIAYSGKSMYVCGWSANLIKKCPCVFKVRFGSKDVTVSKTKRDDVNKLFKDHVQFNDHLGFSAKIEPGFLPRRMIIEMENNEGHWVRIHACFVLRGFKWIRDLFLPKKDYQTWSKSYDARITKELCEIKDHINVFLIKPKFVVVIDDRYSSQALEVSIQSIEAQVYPPDRVIILSNSGQIKTSDSDYEVINKLEFEKLGQHEHDFIVFVSPGSTLKRNALYEFASYINRNPSTEMLYSDEEYSGEDSLRTPFSKPGWSPEYFESCNYIGYSGCYSLKHVRENKISFNNMFDFSLQFTENVENVSHLDDFLLSVNPEQERASRVRDEEIKALQARLERTGRVGVVELQDASPLPSYRVKLTEPHTSLVSVVIPTAGHKTQIGGRETDLILNIVDQIQNHSTYKNIEIIVVDNDDLTDNQQKCLEDSGCIRTSFKEPVFNVAKKLNLGATLASGEFLLLLNDDIDVVEPEWIERMLDQIIKPNVGVVGALLLYPDGTIQHAGVCHNKGLPEHLRRGYPGDESGYFNSTCSVRNFMAVTGACMLTRTDLFDKVGGYSENLAVSFNDTDYCLKCTKEGYRTVYTPMAVLRHYESLSREAFLEPKELAYYQNCWSHILARDPYYNEKYLQSLPGSYEVDFKQGRTL